MLSQPIGGNFHASLFQSRNINQKWYTPWTNQVSILGLIGFLRVIRGDDKDCVVKPGFFFGGLKEFTQRIIGVANGLVNLERSFFELSAMLRRNEIRTMRAQ